jgi:methyl-accepting chemotaxis protein
LSDVPAATVVQDGKVPGDVPKGAAGGKPPRYKRKLSNYMLDRSIQLRYVLLVTILSGVIAGSLGFLIYQQSATASDSIESDLAALTGNDASLDEFRNEEVARLHSGDRALVYKMVGVGLGLVVILSAYLVLMTHKVAGPLYKVSMYFDRMAEGRLGNVTALRKGDMLQDFFSNFREMHEAVRGRQQADVAALETAGAALRAKAGSDAKLAEALDALDKHVAQRKQQLA